MLVEILRLLARGHKTCPPNKFFGRRVCLATTKTKLNLSDDLLFSALQHLEQLGYLERISATPANPKCQGCPLKQTCQREQETPTAFLLTEKGRRFLPACRKQGGTKKK